MYAKFGRLTIESLEDLQVSNSTNLDFSNMFLGSTADAFALFDSLEIKLEQHPGNQDSTIHQQMLFWMIFRSDLASCC